MIDVSDIENKLYSCLQCGYCRTVCPIYRQMGWESATPRGKVYYLKQFTNHSPMSFMNRRKKIDQEFVQRLWQCTSCGICEIYCHVEINFAHLWEIVKERLVRKGFGPLDAHKVIYNRIKDPRRRNPFDDPNNPQRDLVMNRGVWLPKEIRLSSNPEIIFFVGCTESYRRIDLAQAAVKLLSKANVEFSILSGDEWCCGSPLLRTGQTDVVKEELAYHNVNEVERRGIPTLVTACAGCYNTIRGDYPNYVGDLPFKLYHISEYLEILLKKKKLKFSKTIQKRITYHDPCHLGRHGKVFDAPRNVLKTISGITFVEMKHSKVRSRCCGAGGGFKAAFNDIAENIAAERVNDAKKVDAEFIITTCPFCGINLNAGARKAGINIKTLDLVQLCIQAS